MNYITKEEEEKQTHAAEVRSKELLDSENACTINLQVIRDRISESKKDAKKIIKQNRSVTQNLKAYSNLFLDKNINDGQEKIE